MEVTGELRKRLKVAFDNEGIEIPFPQVVMHRPKGVEETVKKYKTKFKSRNRTSEARKFIP
jgi:small conductance mechanosensitive channel